MSACPLTKDEESAIRRMVDPSVAGNRGADLQDTRALLATLDAERVRAERAEAALEQGIVGEVPNRLKRWALDIRNAIPRIERETPRCDFAAGGVADGLHDQILLLLQAAQAIEKAEAALAEMKKQRNDALDLEERTENESRSVRAALAAAVAGHQTLIEGLESIASGKPNMAAIRGWCADEARRLRAAAEAEGR